MILGKLVKRDDHLEAGPQALQDGQVTRSEVGNANREPSQLLDGSSMVRWFSRNRARDSSVEVVAPDWSDNFSLRGNAFC